MRRQSTQQRIYSPMLWPGSVTASQSPTPSPSPPRDGPTLPTTKTKRLPTDEGGILALYGVRLRSPHAVIETIGSSDEGDEEARIQTSGLEYTPGLEYTQRVVHAASSEGGACFLGFGILEYMKLIQAPTQVASLASSSDPGIHHGPRPSASSSSGQGQAPAAGSSKEPAGSSKAPAGSNKAPAAGSSNDTQDRACMYAVLQLDLTCVRSEKF